MLEAVLATMGWAVSNYLIAGVEPGAHGNENTTSAPSGAFRCKGGLVNIAANKDEQWQILARHLGLEALLDDPDFKTREDRKRNRHALRALIEARLEAKAPRDWARELNALGVPAGAVMSVPEALAHPQVAGRGLVAEFGEVPGVDRAVRVLRPGVKMDGAAPEVAAGPPALGADAVEVYGGIGIDEDELARLAGEGVI